MDDMGNRKSLTFLGCLLYLVLIPVAILLLAFHDRNSRRDLAETNRRAIVLIARTACDRDAVFRNAAIADARSEAQIERVNHFFDEFAKPVNRALILLNAAPCPTPKRQ